MNANGTPRVHLEGVTHRFGDVTALEEVTLDVHDGEFVTLLGPSGCGKTTLLRVVGGFERPTTGRVLIGGADVTRLPAHRRPVNMVFQRPTLFPHLNVADNVAFGLRIAHVPREEARERIRSALALVRLEGYDKRKNYELSGGQMQRVALARALVNRPQVLLLDEPLSALDLKIRLDMETELRRVHRETGATFIYVTHDQREALALSDRIVVLNAGSIEQVGEPNEVYRRPATPFVARFVGDANVLPVTVDRDSTGLRSRLGEHEVAVAEDSGEGPAWLVLRPEVISVREPSSDDQLTGTVRDVSFRGTGFSYRVAVDGVEEPIKAEVSGGQPFPIGSRVALAWDTPSGSTLPRFTDEP